MRNIYTLLLSLIPALAFSQAMPDTTQKIVPGRANSKAQQHKPYIILISADGFRHDLADKHHATNCLR